jgi:hypothetical protein
MSEIDGVLADILLEHFGTGPKKGRGRTQRSLDLIEAMHSIAGACQPITGRGVGYKLFTRNLIPSMSRKDMRSVYRLLLEAREEDTIPWELIVDETRELEKVSAWDDPAAFIATVSKAYRRDFWNQQPVRVEVWSEKGTVRGVLAPTLDEYGVGFLVLQGFSGATAINNAAESDSERPLIVLYVGDYDPSGMWMSEKDLPSRLERYGGDHVTIKRVALMRHDCVGLPSFPASDKRTDSRYRWFVRIYGPECWELDALDPNRLRAKVESAIKDHIEPVAWGDASR